jgi:acyl-[acyl-carrier-protein]-phospholipid O-acyltransferase/long-chain-fatty-acid--[acyl-carrier-protein] ligase
MPASETGTALPPATRRVGFAGLLVSQFLGAFNDHAFKMMILLLATEPAAEAAGWTEERLLSLTGVLLMVPFALFSLPAGALSDRFSKKRVLVWTKLLEVAVMGLATAGFVLGQVELLLGLFFLIALQAALYSPAKFGILPELLTEEELSMGNGLIELLTFVAIILGIMAPAHLRIWCGGSLPAACGVLAGLAVTGLLATFLVPPLAPAAPGRRLSANPFTGLGTYTGILRRDRPLRLTVLGMVFFWSAATFMLQGSILYASKTLHLGATEQTYPYIGLAVGVGAGSGLAGWLSDHKVELGLVPLGAFGMVVFGLALSGMGGWSLYYVLPAFALLGASAGFFIVPLNALLQQRSPSTEKGGLVAASNFFQAVGMTAAAVLFMVLSDTLHLRPTTLFLVAALLTAGVAVYLFRLLPEALVRFVLWFLAQGIYRIRVEGRDRIPPHGPALLVCNHPSLVDGLFVLASTHRFVRFMMNQGLADTPVARWVFRAMGVIPVTTTEGPRALIASLREASRALKEGHVVCLFAEGEVTRTGQMLPFRIGVERILRDAPPDTPLIPVHLDRVWGSLFSFQGGRFVWKRPRRFPYPVTVSIGHPLPATATVFELRQAIQEQGAEAFVHRHGDLEPLHRAFARTAQRMGSRLALADSTGARRTFLGTLAGALVLARRMRGRWAGQERVGILLPPSVAAATANIAALLAGRVPVNLNYTASAESLRSAAAQCGLRTVLTSRAFLERVKVDVPAEPVFVEEIAGAVTARERFGAGLAARWLPLSRLERLAGRDRPARLDDVATVIFSSGSTGEPKGVQLTHANILSNVEALAQLYDPGPADGVLGILPFFHSFGFTGTLWFPLLYGMRAVYHVNPLDAAAVGTLVREHGATYLLATPTFLQAYTRRCEPGDLGSLRHVIVGAEKLSDRVADAFETKFGIAPREGYGCTECSPIVAVNAPDYRARGLRQVGGKRGRIGHPVPGVTVKIVDPGTFAPRPPGEEGLLVVKGPNVMKGYLGRPDLTAAAIRDGWYLTGDIARMEEDGFLVITDRLSRFSKIGGEMVPHVKIEETLHAAIGAAEQVLVVTGVPDEKKGERLAVLHTLPEERVRELTGKLGGLGLPNLWLPRAESFHRVDSIPLLGSGKTDLKRVKELAREFEGADSGDSTGAPPGL